MGIFLAGGRLWVLKCDRGAGAGADCLKDSPHRRKNTYWDMQETSPLMTVVKLNQENLSLKPFDVWLLKH